MTKPREKTREELTAEIEEGKKKIRQFENREKIIKQKLSVEERKARNHRLCKRGGFMESLVPELIAMPDEDAKAFLRLALMSEPAQEFLKKRAGMIEARHKLVETLQDDDFDYKGIREIVDYDKRIEEHNIEQLSAKLLFDLTRNTGFEVSKGTLGECWIKSCCEWGNRQEDDICGLDHNRLAVFDKMKRIYDGSSLKLQFPKVGLEVVA